MHVGISSRTRDRIRGQVGMEIERSDLPRYNIIDRSHSDVILSKADNCSCGLLGLDVIIANRFGYKQNIDTIKASLIHGLIPKTQEKKKVLPLIGKYCQLLNHPITFF
jgi:hypothetical protein